MWFLKTHVFWKNVIYSYDNIFFSACMWSSGAGYSDFIESRMNKIYYYNIYKKYNKECVEKFGITDDFYFQQDNDSKHTPYIARL